MEPTEAIGGIQSWGGGDSGPERRPKRPFPDPSGDGTSAAERDATRRPQADGPIAREARAVPAPKTETPAAPPEGKLEDVDESTGEPKRHIDIWV